MAKKVSIISCQLTNNELGGTISTNLCFTIYLVRNLLLM